MCTLTFLPLKNQYIITSNRDELATRPTLPSNQYNVDNHQIWFPKDTKAGGTWIAADQRGWVICLLNGAFKAHEMNPPYARSRGLIVLDVFSYPSLNEFCHSIDLKGVEPFTMILFNSKDADLIEFRWDGEKKYQSNKNVDQPHMWCSTLLYNQQARKMKENWFNQRLNNKELNSKEDILHFHSHRWGTDPENDMIIERENGLKTVSITQVILNDQQNAEMNYLDLQTQSHQHTQFQLS